LRKKAGTLPPESGQMERSEFIAGNQVYLPLDEDRAAPVSEAQITCFVAALARALHAFVTYPRRSPARDDVVLSVQKALRDCNTGSVVLQITNDGIQFDGCNLDVSGNVERGLVFLLRRAFVSALEFENTASTRDLSQFCEILAAPDAQEPRRFDDPGSCHILAPDDRGRSNFC